MSAPPEGIGETCEPPDDLVPGDGEAARVEPEARDDGRGVDVSPPPPPLPPPVAVAVGVAVEVRVEVGAAVPVGRAVPDGIGTEVPLVLGLGDTGALTDGAGLADGVTAMMLVVTDVEQVTTLAPGFPVPLHWLTVTGMAVLTVEAVTVQTTVAPAPPLPEPLHWVTVAPDVVAGNGLHWGVLLVAEPTHWSTVAGDTELAPG